MPGYGLEDRIRELCAKAATASDDETLEALQDLRRALHEHARQLRAMAAQTFTGGMQGANEERRSKK